MQDNFRKKNISMFSVIQLHGHKTTAFQMSTKLCIIIIWRIKGIFFFSVCMYVQWLWNLDDDYPKQILMQLRLIFFIFRQLIIILMKNALKIFLCFSKLANRQVTRFRKHPTRDNARDLSFFAAFLNTLLANRTEYRKMDIMSYLKCVLFSFQKMKIY